MTTENIEWKEHRITIPINKIEKNKNYNRLKKELTKLRHKDIEFELKKNGSEKITQIVTGLISGFEHEQGSEDITFIIPSSVLPFICSIAQGFTTFQTVVAISLSSIYSKRLYEICCRWKNYNNGYYKYDLDEFRSILKIENKYKQVGELRKSVLNIASKELKEKADVWFEYELKKENSRSFNKIHLTIYSNSNDSIKIGEKGEAYSFLHRFFCHTYSSLKSCKAIEICDCLSEKEMLNHAYSRFKQIEHEIIKGERDDSERIPLTKYILKEDYGIT